VKVILLLTGSIQGTKNKVNEFLASFSKYEWLYKLSITENCKQFNLNNPSIQDYDDELRRFTGIEEELDKINGAMMIGAMSVKTKVLI